MKRLAVLGSTFLVALALTGCGADPREEEVTKALNFFNRAADNTNKVKEEVTKAVADAKKNHKRLKADDFKPAENAAKELHDIGKQLLNTKGQIDLLQEKASPEEKKRLDEKFSGQLQALFERLGKAQKGLDDALVEAQANAEDGALEPLRKAINDSREEFRILTKPH